jgi:hypothetical protein
MIRTTSSMCCTTSYIYNHTARFTYTNPAALFGVFRA